MVVQDEVGVDQLDSLMTVLELIRTEKAASRPEISRLTGYGRALVTQRVATLLALELVAEGDAVILGRGRAPRTLMSSGLTRAYTSVTATANSTTTSMRLLNPIGLARSSGRSSIRPVIATNSNGFHSDWTRTDAPICHAACPLPDRWTTEPGTCARGITAPVAIHCLPPSGPATL